MAKKKAKVEHKFYTYTHNGKAVHFKDGTPRVVGEEYVKNNSLTFDHNEYTYHHSEWTED